MAQGRAGRWAMKTGPDNAKCVIWAIGKFVFLSSFINTNYI